MPIFSNEMTNKKVMSVLGRRAEGRMFGFFETNFATLSIPMFPGMPLWLGTYKKVVSQELA